MKSALSWTCFEPLGSTTFVVNLEREAGVTGESDDWRAVGFAALVELLGRDSACEAVCSGSEFGLIFREAAELIACRIVNSGTAGRA